MSEAARAFQTRFGAPPDATVAVPGRVNLIGDHIDYCGLPVLPAAIQRRISLQFRVRDDRIIRIDSTAEPRREFEITHPIPAFPAGDWGNYARAAIVEMMGDASRPRGFDALLESSIPPSAGLSSSSAIVVAVALAFIHANELRIDRIQLAARLALAERHVGTVGGGMDQAIVLLAEHGHASLIEFDPLRVKAVTVPPTWTFVLAHSLVHAQKSGAAREAYNSRPAEAESALAFVASRLRTPEARYSDVIERFPIGHLIETAAHAPFPLDKRFTHVVTEADRVRRAVAAMQSGDAEGFGTLMTESHESLRTRCEVSHPRLDRLARLCLVAGALGARLTGAGFGGFVVALVLRDRAEPMMAQLSKEFYGPRAVEPEAMQDVLFIARPSRGASAEIANH